MELTPSQSLAQLSILNAEVGDVDFEDVLVRELIARWPPELVTRLEDLWSATREIAGEIVAVGKIIVLKILEFIRAHPKIAIGAAVGAIVGVLTSAIPFIGSLIAPLATTVSVLYGAAIGAAMEKGDHSLSPISGGIALVEAFFELFIAIFRGIGEYWTV